MPPQAVVATNLEAVRRRIGAAAARVGRPATAVRLIAVSKTFSATDIRAAVAAGHRVFGENRVQEGLGKIDQLADLDLEWHLLGHLQSNKIRKAAASFGWIESVDSVETLRRLDAAAAEAGLRPQVLLQVDLAGEASKHGVPAAGLRPLVDAALEARAVILRGLMVVPPFPESPEQSRPWFRQLRELRDRLAADGVPAGQMAELSMGMSGDFEVAIEEGATLVRVGTAIFGRRPPPAPR